jgi:hypothetical protein
VSVNKYLPHVLVLPEDNANRQLANGFLMGLHNSVWNRIQVLEEVGGWQEVLDRFEANHVAAMDRYDKRFMILLIDFDGRVERLNMAKVRIPERLIDRVFVVGALGEPEGLKTAGLGSYETIGIRVARECHDETDATLWEHPLLRHNAGELARIREHVRPILF